MKKKIYKLLFEKHRRGQKGFIVLIDPDKVDDNEKLVSLIKSGKEYDIDFFFVGGSLLMKENGAEVIRSIKQNCDIPVVLFPANHFHIEEEADGILFLSLISGRNPEFLIGQHVVAAPMLKNAELEILPTGYILIGDSHETTVAYMSNTIPIPLNKPDIASSTAMAGEMLGLKLIYLDAGSGASLPVPVKTIKSVSRSIELPLIVGGGINTIEKAQESYLAGADMIVIGNALEKGSNLLIDVSELKHQLNSDLKIH